jgi:hypothetical protein
MACPAWCVDHDKVPTRGMHASEEVILDYPVVFIVAWLTAPLDAPDLTELRLESDGAVTEGVLLDSSHVDRLAEASESFGRQLRVITAGKDLA